jgi:hypothetical protein
VCVCVCVCNHCTYSYSGDENACIYINDCDITPLHYTTLRYTVRAEHYRGQLEGCSARDMQRVLALLHSKRNALVFQVCVLVCV